MWLLPWNPNSDFYSQYEIGDQIISLNSKSIWTIFKAKKKNSGQHVTIFRFDFKEPNNPCIERAKQSLKRIKTLRHPSILKYVDSNETDKSICIVTESIVPLSDYLDETSNNFTQTQKDFSIAYGLLNVAKGVWKIGGLEYICPIDQDKSCQRNDNLTEKYIPPEILDPNKVRHPGAPFAVDSWGFGCLVWECFNKPIGTNSSVKTVGKMPKPLSVYYNKLVQTSPRNRISPMNFIEDAKKADVFFNTPLIETILFLEEIQLVKEPNEKNKFFNRLEAELESFPVDICNNKILPELINAFEYGEAGSSILNPIFKIGKSLDEEAYQTKLVPCIIKLFACKDRATRSKLLQQLDSYINFLSPNVINDQIFPQVIQGFLDSNFTIREQTVKSMLHLAPKLSSTNLNEELVKHFARLQTRDEEGGIRANTTVCLGKIAKYLSVQTQQTILLPTFLRMFRDQFPPARHAAIAGISANESLFNIKDCATKIMPALCQMCIDPDTNVRRLSFKSLKLFMDKVQAQSEIDADAQKKPSETTIATSEGSTSSERKQKNTSGKLTNSIEDMRKETELIKIK